MKIAERKGSLEVLGCKDCNRLGPELWLVLLHAGNDPLEHLVGIVAHGPYDNQEAQQDTQHGSVFGHALALFGAEEFSAEAFNV